MFFKSAYKGDGLESISKESEQKIKDLKKFNYTKTLKMRSLRRVSQLVYLNFNKFHARLRNS